MRAVRSSWLTNRQGKGENTHQNLRYAADDNVKRIGEIK